MIRELTMKLFLALFFAAAAYAQFEQGSIVGTVTDPQQAPIANARVQIRHFDASFIGL